ncbi:MAG: nodulation protein NfeD [Candidatus Zixiibacteriota bacterium]
MTFSYSKANSFNRLVSPGLAGLFAVGLAVLAGAPLAQDDTAPDTQATTGAVADTIPYIEPSLVYILDLEEAIGVVTAKRIVEAIELAEEDTAEALVIMLDTPGGFTASTWTINKAILNSHVPVIVFIGPAGSRAGSAGVYITYASHIAAMAPGTNIGSAHPVGGGGEEIDSIMNEKVTNDAVASIRAMAKKRGRNEEWAESAVRESVNVTASEADSLGVIDVLAESRGELYDKIDGWEVETPIGQKKLNLRRVDEVELDLSFIESVLRLISSPNIAFLLLSIGGLGIMMEIYNPGAIFPGVVGVICMILGMYAMQTLPINSAGVALMIFAIILFIAEIKITSYGLLTVGGVISLALGGMMLIDSTDPSLKVDLTLIWIISIAVGLVMAIVISLVVRARSRQVATGSEGMIGEIGEARSNLAPEGMVYVDGELWKARSSETINNGEKIVVTEVDGIHLIVKKST